MATPLRIADLPLGQAIAFVRNGRKMSQTETALKAGVGRNTLNRIELGHTSPHVAVLEDIADALDVEAWMLLRHATRIHDRTQAAAQETAHGR